MLIVEQTFGASWGTIVPIAGMVVIAGALTGQGISALLSFSFEKLCMSSSRITYYDKLGRRRVDAPIGEIRTVEVRFSLFAHMNRCHVISGDTWTICFSDYLVRGNELLGRLKELYEAGNIALDNPNQP